MKENEPRITVRELMDELSGYSPDTEVSFSGLEFSRLKPRSKKTVQVEFVESVYRDAQGLVVVQNHPKPKQ